MTGAPGRIVVVRHGETDWNSERRIQGRSDLPLNDAGRAQAEAAGVVLASAGQWRTIVSSPLRRAVETAEIIARRLGLDAPLTDAALIERDYGSAEGLPVADAGRYWPGLDIPDAEPLDLLGRRAVDVLTLHLARPGTVVVAHGALLRAGLTRLAGHAVPRIANGEAWLIEDDGAARAVWRLSGAHSLGASA